MHSQGRTAVEQPRRTFPEYSLGEAIEGTNFPACYYSAFNSDFQNLALLLGDISHLDSPSWNPSLQQVETAVEKRALSHAGGMTPA